MTESIYLLFPGRHLINTNFQYNYLLEHLSKPISQWKDFYNKDRLNNLVSECENEQVDRNGISHLVFCVTSSNLQNSRYNPIPFYVRAIGLDRFGQQVVKSTQFRNTEMDQKDDEAARVRRVREETAYR